MSQILEYIDSNKEWIFSGVGIIIILKLYNLISNFLKGSTVQLKELATKSTNLQELFLEVDMLALEMKKDRPMEKRKSILSSTIKLKKKLVRLKDDLDKRLMYFNKNISRLRANMYKMNEMKNEYKEQELKDQSDSFYQIAEKEYNSMCDVYMRIHSQIQEAELKISHLTSMITALSTDKLRL